MHTHIKLTAGAPAECVPRQPARRRLEPQQAEDIIAQGQADLVMLARKELDDAHFPYHAAKALGVLERQQVLPPQYTHWLKRR